MHSFPSIVCTFSSNARHQNKTTILLPVFTSVISLFSYDFVYVFEYTFAIVSKAGYHFEGKVQKPGEKIICWSAQPRAIESQVDPTLCIHVI